MSKLNKVAVTDAGGRGAALVHAYSKSPHVGKIVAMPGNDLMQMNVRQDVSLERIPQALSSKEGLKIAAMLRCTGAHLADVCQDDVVAGGTVNSLRVLGVRTVGPTKEAGRLEWDKAWAREFMKQNDIPHPAFHVFHTEQAGLAFLRRADDGPWAVKASGLAAGKGVVLAFHNEDAAEAIKQMKNFGEAGKEYLLEEFLEGEEFSAYAISDGESYKKLGNAQDHKRAFDGDEGPNTGGMGCVSRPMIVTPAIEMQVDDIFKKTFDGLKKMGIPYTGVLYLGAIVSNGKVNVIEFNARWGDPEAQVLVPAIQTDLFEIGQAVVEKRLDKMKIEIDNKVRVTIALASKGYPGDASGAKGKEILGIDDAAIQAGVTIYGAGVKHENGHSYMAGGRVLYVNGEGDDVLQARDIAYGAMDRIFVEDRKGHFRKDIGYRDVERLKQG